ncbi:MAG: hypothetical protein EOO45_13535 [Flavobacterium sp.]|nr:MAG: hypothetical protein EOO45_13535 [Flavobacterium sp.]
MRQFILIIVIFFAINAYGKEEYIYFKIDASISFDSITFKNKRVDVYNNVVKLKKDKQISFEFIYRGKKYLFTIASAQLNKLNILSVDTTHSEKVSLTIEKRHIIKTVDYSDYKSDVFELNIKSATLWLDNGVLITDSNEFENDLKSNPEFFLN